MFQAGIVGKNGEQTNSDQLFDQMLSQLYLPLVNLNSYLRNVLDGQNPGRKEDLGSSIVQLKTKAEVLQFAFDRVISEMVLDKYTRPAPVAVSPSKVIEHSA